MLQCMRIRLDGDFPINPETFFEDPDRRTILRSFTRQVIKDFILEFNERGLPWHYRLVGKRIVAIAPVDVYYEFNPRKDIIEVTVYTWLFGDDRWFDGVSNTHQVDADSLELFADNSTQATHDRSKEFVWKDEEYFADGYVCEYQSPCMMEHWRSSEED